AMAVPAAAPRNARTRFSTSSSRRRRITPAPRAARTTSSCSRRTPRMSVRLTTLAVEMTITNAAAAMRSHSVRRARSPIASLNGRTATRKCDPGSYDSLYSDCMRAYTVATWARASSTVAPGARRPTISVIRCVRPNTIVALKWCGLTTMLSRASAWLGKYGAAWTTPITVADPSSSRTCLPTMVGSAWNRRRQNCSVRTITGGTPGPSSLALVRRPRMGRRPITSKKLPVTRPTLMRAVGEYWSPCRMSAHGENSAMPPNAGTPARKSRTSGTEQAIAVAVGQRLEQHAAHDAENRGVGADAQRQCDDDHRGERGTVAQRLERVAEIGHRALQPWQAALRAHRLGGDREAARRHQCPATRFVRRNAAAHILGRLHVQVRLQFLAEIVIAAMPGENAGQAGEPGTNVSHGASPSRRGARKAAIRSAVRCQSRVSRASCLRPVAVSV